VRATDVGGAVAALAGGGVALAGGTGLVPQIARGLLDAAVVVDVSRLEPLRELRLEADALHLGAGVRLADLLARDDLPPEHAALTEAAAEIGNPLVRRIGTVGGNLGLRLPQADLQPPLLALGAEVVCAGPGGEERRPVGDVVAGAVPQDRLILAVRVPLAPGSRSAFAKLAWRRSTGSSVASAAALVGPDGTARVAVGGVGPARLVAPERVADEVGPLDGYRRGLVAEAVRRALERAGRP
jgi:carbon-monoxide dehydrogenase medium subunit